ncbi:unnamed protein product [Albugo candida]|uniref:Uncharacterized protein n=1 Tax=Albugo candida TaxID=65357 RepID=A0A024GUE6_9STRA|nr:unnamed protein product [Albugo candida]|eukprot:CCI50577.1 unnamed protein product [Albugo candida]
MLDATAGSLIGVGGIVLLPLDVLRIRAQMNPAAIAARGIIKIFKQERLAFRLQRVLLSAKCSSHVTFVQNFVASIFGAPARILVAQALDVIKTRVQSRPYNSPESGISIVRNLIQQDGASALFEGLMPKLSVLGPKLNFSYAVAQHLIAYFKTFSGLITI